MFLNHGEIYFKEQFFLLAVKENIPRKQIPHPLEQNVPIHGQRSLRKLHLRAGSIMTWEPIHLQGLSSLTWDQLVLILGSI